MAESEWVTQLRSATASETWHAARVSIGLVVPELGLIAVDRPKLIAFAAFGSFTGMYGRADLGRTLSCDKK